MLSELFVWNVKAVEKGAKDGGLPILVIDTPNSTPAATASVIKTSILLPDCEQFKLTGVKLAQAMAPEMTKLPGNPIISFLEAGKAGGCLILNV